MHAPTPTDVASLTLAEAAHLVRSGKVSPVELTEACLRRIEKLQPSLNAFITVMRDTAVDEARAAERQVREKGWRGPLHGIPVALKDLVDIAGVPTTAASALFETNVPVRDAALVSRLREAGAILLGKLNLHEFAYGGSGMISRYGPARNPWATDRITGGSSSGSAAAVAGRLCYAAVGTDTAGSIRVPAACCGIVGFKPTYGAVSTRGVVPLSWSYDHAGPMARSVEDAALLLEAIAGFDPQDLNSRMLAPVHYANELGGNTRGLRIGIARSFYFDDLDREVASCVEEALAVLRGMTAAMVDVQFPADIDRTVQSCESWAYHAEWATRHPELYQPETLRRLRHGAEVGATEYIRRKQDLERTRRNAMGLFVHAGVDLVVTPACPIPAPVIAELEAQPDELRRRELVMLRNTRPWNVLGTPAISVPCGFTAKGLPVGLQIAGPPGHDAIVLRLGHAYEQATEWHKYAPAA